MNLGVVLHLQELSDRRLESGNSLIELPDLFVTIAVLIAVDGGRTKPLGSARERRAVQVSVSCEVGGGLRR